MKCRAYFPLEWLAYAFLDSLPFETETKVYQDKEHNSKYYTAEYYYNKKSKKSIDKDNKEWYNIN